MKCCGNYGKCSLNQAFRRLFYANHASNYLPIKARLPKGKSEALAQIDAVLAGDAAIKPEYLRAL